MERLLEAMEQLERFRPQMANALHGAIQNLVDPVSQEAGGGAPGGQQPGQPARQQEAERLPPAHLARRLRNKLAKHDDLIEKAKVYNAELKEAHAVQQEIAMAIQADLQQRKVRLRGLQKERRRLRQEYEAIAREVEDQDVFSTASEGESTVDYEAARGGEGEDARMEGVDDPRGPGEHAAEEPRAGGPAAAPAGAGVASGGGPAAPPPMGIEGAVLVDPFILAPPPAAPTTSLPRAPGLLEAARARPRPEGSAASVARDREQDEVERKAKEARRRERSRSSFGGSSRGEADSDAALEPPRSLLVAATEVEPGSAHAAHAASRQILQDLARAERDHALAGAAAAAAGGPPPLG